MLGNKKKEMNREMGRYIKLLRKHSGVNQSTLGKILHLHQTAVCRVEQGRQELTAVHLHQITKHFSITLDDLFTGRINFWDLAKRFNRKPPYDSKYLDLPFSKVRESTPVLFFLNESKGDKYTYTLLEKLGLENLQFSSPDQCIGVHCLLDLFKHSINRRIITKNSIPKLIKQTRAPLVHGLLSSVYLSQRDSIGLVQALISNASYYESNFQYTIEDVNPKSLDISIHPKDHMSLVDYKNDTLGDFLCTYKKAYLSEFPIFIGSKPLQVTEQECHFHGSLKCIYTLATA